jgi:hypothetical protein
MNMTSETMDIQEVAAFCRAEPETIAQYARSGTLPGTKMGKGWVFLRDDVVGFLRERIADETKMRRAKTKDTVRMPEPIGVAFERPAKLRRTALPLLPTYPKQQTSP